MNYSTALKLKQEAEEKEKAAFKQRLTLTLGELQELLQCNLSCDLRTKLASAEREARRAYGMRNVNFGDLKEDEPSQDL